MNYSLRCRSEKTAAEVNIGNYTSNMLQLLQLGVSDSLAVIGFNDASLHNPKILALRRKLINQLIPDGSISYNHFTVDAQ